jgi:eukaryotic-like serine/threonine-protein kinase
MTPARRRQIEDLYQAALSTDTNLRSALLAQADPDVRLAVERMLDQPGAGSPFDSPAWVGMSGSVAQQPSIGSQLGPYRIEASIGSGGMGEVYRAIDTRLQRSVAIKISTEQFNTRFEREARAIAALNHPNICTIHDVGPNYLVMELVEGPTLAERIRQGPLPIEEALTIARQIADALEAAHEQNIVHRDLKPPNIKIKPDGAIKVLDFGLARITKPPGRPDAEDPTHTLTVTQAGTIMGTPSYMAPEQALGKTVDKRADIWALGVILYEMLAGVRPFKGGTPHETLQAVLTQEPDWDRVPPGARPLLRRLLEKDPKRRLRDIADAQFVLQESPAAQIAPTLGRNSRTWWIVAAAALILGVLGGWAASRFRETPADDRAFSLQLNPPEGSPFMLTTNTGGMALSPDGKTVAFIATTNAKTALWVRPLDSSSPRPLAGTEGAALPFWSPDSRSIGFQAQGKLLRIDLPSGAPHSICDVGLAPGGTWASNGQILYAAWNSSIYQVPASGGQATPLTTLDASRGESFHYWPQMLPGGRFLYFVRSNKRENTGVYVSSLSKPSERVPLLATNTNALFAPGHGDNGYLLWLRGETLVAQDFNVATLKLSGEPRQIATPVAALGVHGQMQVSVSANGTLLYAASNSLNQFVWLDRTGKNLGLLGEPQNVGPFEVAPDGRRVAVERVRPDGTDIWILDVDRNIYSRLTSRPGLNLGPIWSPDGRTILFTSGSPFNLFRKETGGASVEQKLISSPNGQFGMDWSHDGRFILYEEDTDAGNHRALWYLPLAPADAVPKPYLPTQFNTFMGRFSPDTRWLAFQSDESGRFEVYIDAFPEPRGKVQISTGGGYLPSWGAGGRELFYVSADSKLMSVSLKLGANSVEPSTPHELFPVHPAQSDISPYAPSPNGQRFLVVQASEKLLPLTVIVNWPALMNKGTNSQ